MDERTKLGLGVLGAAAILGLLGDLLLRATPWGLNVGLWAAAFVFMGAALAIWRGVRLGGEGRWLAAPFLLFAALLVWRDSNTLAFVNGFAALISLTLAVFRSRAGRVVTAGLADYLYLGAQATGYAYAGPLPLAIRDVAWRQTRLAGYGTLFAVLRGLILVVPLLLVFGGLFVAADAVFGRLVSDLLDFDLAEVFGHLLLFALFAWVSAGLLRPALIGGELPKPAGRPGYLRLGIVELGVALGLLNALFLSFVIVQARYFFGGADAVLASEYGLTYAEYARRGFFELAAVTALVLPLLLLAHWLLRTEKPAHLRLFKLLSGALVGLLLVVMASAVGRMRLYTAEFGLTELRLYTTAFMFWLLAVLLWLVCTVLLRDQRRLFAFGALLTGFVAVFALNVLNPDGLIVRHNVARMEAGERFDAPYLASLSADAVPPLLAALPAMNAPDRETIESQLRRRWASSDDTDWRTYNASRAHARSLVRRQAASPDSTSTKTSQETDIVLDGASYPQHVVDNGG